MRTRISGCILLLSVYLLAGTASAQGIFDLTYNSGGPNAAGDPMGLYQTSTQTQLIVYRAVDSHVHQLTSPTPQMCHGEIWCDTDLTSLVGATATAGNPWEYLENNIQAIVFRGTDSQIYQLWTSPNWTSSDLTVLAAAPQASGDPTGLYSSSQNEQLVVYVAVDGHIHQLYTTNNNTKWVQADLTSITGAPLPAGRPMEYLVGGQQVVVYRGTDNHVHQLYTASSKWTYDDLTSLTGAPDTSGDPSGLYNSNTNQQLIVFTGSDQHVHQLWSNSGTWKDSDLTQQVGSPTAGGTPFEFIVGTEQLVPYTPNPPQPLQTLYLNPGPAWANFGFESLLYVLGNPFGYVVSAQLPTFCGLPTCKFIVYRDESSHVDQAYLDR